MHVVVITIYDGYNVRALDIIVGLSYLLHNAALQRAVSSRSIDGVFRAYVALSWACHDSISEYLDRFGGRDVTEEEVPIEPLLRRPCLDGLEWEEGWEECF